jgi:hypothetical protein
MLPKQVLNFRNLNVVVGSEQGAKAENRNDLK